eukprot:jgi/Phyca11/563705/estExt2_Genewise1.C_PHYCAscaffold_130013
MSSLLDVAKAMNAESSVNVSDGKSLTLMDVVQQEVQAPKQTLQQVAQEINEEDRSRIQTALDSKAKAVKDERQQLRSQTLRQTAVEMQQEEQKSAQVLQAKPVDEEEPYEAPPRTTPSESKESKEFLRAVYRADKYHIRDMLNEEVVDANIADQHGWSGLHWAASQNHTEILKLLLQEGAQVNAIDQINGWTALHVAVVRESISCISILLSSGADPRIRDNYGDTVVDCLQAASRKKKVKMLQLLQEARNNS